MKKIKIIFLTVLIFLFYINGSIFCYENDFKQIQNKINSTKIDIRETALWDFTSHPDRNKALTLIKIIIPLLKDKNIDLRREAYSHIGRLFLIPSKDKYSFGEKTFYPERIIIDKTYVKAAKFIIPILIQGLQDNDKKIRSYSALSLGRIGPIAVNAIPFLSNNIDDDYYLVRYYSIVAIVNIDQKVNKKTILKIINRINDENEHVNWAAKEALKYIRSK